jgi:hypothetical protein
MKKRMYLTPAVSVVCIVPEGGIAQTASPLSGSVGSKEARWEAEEVIGDDGSENGIYYAW